MHWLKEETMSEKMKSHLFHKHSNQGSQYLLGVVSKQETLGQREHLDEQEIQIKKETSQDIVADVSVVLEKSRTMMHGHDDDHVHDDDHGHDYEHMAIS